MLRLGSFRLGPVRAEEGLRRSRARGYQSGEHASCFQLSQQRQPLPERWEAGAECASVDYFMVLHTEERRQLTAGSRELTTEIGVVLFCLLRLGETAVYRF